MLNAQGLGFTFFAVDLATPTIAKIARAFTGLDERVGTSNAGMQRASKVFKFGAATFSVGAAAMAGAFGLANLAGEFEQSIAAVGAISGASADELTMLHDAAIDAGIATQFSPTEATVGLKELAQAGFNAQESMKLLIPVLDLAAGSFGGLTPASAAGLAAQTMKAFGLSVTDASLAVDQMLKVNSLGLALKAEDLPLALGTAARGATTFHQSLEETLISLGLVKNVIPGVERASTAVAVAMERMVKPETQAALKGIGVSALNADKSFRPFLDILGDMAPALGKMTEAQRSAFLLKTFGGEALGGVSAILTQATKGIRTNTGETLKGGEAFKYLRTQLAGAAGTASAFRDKMLDTFAGQKQLLRGSLETLGILLGEPLAQVFKPIVGAVVDALNVLLGVLRVTPMSVKRAVGGFLVAGLALVMLVGAVIMAQGAIGWFVAGIGNIVAAISAASAVILPAIAIIAVLAAVIAGLYVAYKHNLGGIADFLNRMGAQTQLFFQGLSQLITQSGFSGAVLDELNKAENSGLKQFVIQVWMIAYRLQRIWEGFSDGFSAAIEGAAPLFAQFVAAFQELGAEVSAIFASLTGGASGLPSDKFRSFGEAVGAALGQVVGYIAAGIAIVVRFYSGILSGAQAMAGFVGPAFTALGDAVGRLFDVLGNLLGMTGKTGDSAATLGTVFHVLGQIVGGTLAIAVGVAVDAITFFVDLLTGVIQVAGLVKDDLSETFTWIVNVATWLFDAISEPLSKFASGAIQSISDFCAPMVDSLTSVGNTVLSLFRTVGTGIRTLLQPVFDFFEGMGTKLMSALTRAQDFVISHLRKVPVQLLPPSLAALAALPLSTEVQPATGTAQANTEATAARAEAASSSMPAAADASAHADQAALVSAAVAAAGANSSQAPGPPQVINLVVDDQVLASVMSGANKDNASRSFTPVASY